MEINFIFLILLMILATLFGALGSLFFKIALGRSKNFIRIIFSSYLYYGLICFGLGFLIYLYLLKSNDVSFLFPITSLTYVWSIVLAKIYLKEEVTSYKKLGITLIIVGVVLLSL